MDFSFDLKKYLFFFRALNAQIENKWVPGTRRRPRFIALFLFFSVGIGVRSTSKCPEFCFVPVLRPK